MPQDDRVNRTKETRHRLKPRPAITKMEAYRPPASGRVGKLRLDFNENTQGCSPRVLKRLGLLRAAPQAAVLVDEAYFEFSGRTVLPWIGRYENLFVSRTFSKAYGLAALRVGCLFSNERNIAAIRKGQSPYSVNMAGVTAALAA